jgi:Tol biopolymer transport system component
LVPEPDGKINFLARDGDGSAIFEADADGQNRRRVFGSATMQELRASPDGRFLVFAEQQNDLTQLFRIDRNGGDRRQLTFGNSSKIDSSISPDGKSIVYSDDGGSDTFSLQRIPSDGGAPEKLLNEYCGAPNYSHGGQFISCFLQDGKIRILSAETGQTVGELNPESSLLLNSGARWTPNDKDVVYRVVKSATTNLWRQPVAGGDPQPLTRFPKGDIYNFAYSSDGTKIYLSRGAQIRNAVLIRGFR